MKNVFYIQDDDSSAGYFTVEFIVNKTGTELVKHFDSPVLARAFAVKVRKSKKLTLIGKGGFI